MVAAVKRTLQLLFYTKLLALFLLASNVACAIIVYAFAPEPLVAGDPAIAVAVAAEIAKQSATDRAANYQLANLVISGLVAVLVAYFSSRQGTLLRELKVATDGMTTKLIASEKIVSKQEGVTEEKARQADAPASTRVEAAAPIAGGKLTIVADSATVKGAGEKEAL